MIKTNQIYFQSIDTDIQLNNIQKNQKTVLAKIHRQTIAPVLKVFRLKMETKVVGRRRGFELVVVRFLLADLHEK